MKKSKNNQTKTIEVVSSYTKIIIGLNSRTEVKKQISEFSIKYQNASKRNQQIV